MFNSKIAGVAIAGIALVLIVHDINFIIYCYFSAIKPFEAHGAG